MPKQNRRPTLKLIAERAGVSLATVSLALNNKGQLAAARKRQIQLIAKELNYTPSLLGRALRSGRTSTIGVIVNYFSNPFFQGIYDGIQEVVERRQYEFSVSQAQDSLEREMSLVLRMADQRVDGLIVHLSSSMRVDHIRAAQERYGIPVVLIAHAHPDFTAVVADNREGTRMAMEHLLPLGRRILHIAGPEDRSSTRLRLEAYTEVMRQHFPDFDEHKDMCRIRSLTADGGYKAMHWLMERHAPPVSLFAANDVTAFGALRYCREHCLRVPGDVSMLTFGGNPLIDALGLELSSVNIPFQDMGRAAASTVLECIASPELAGMPRLITLPASLTVRGSTRL